ncbi:hypothetical protein HCEG_00123 [Histoplasma capsulatum var. duboisii H88]|uniref:Uncharacterized protein n=1 Tax=Ajellomyces capsulatus (strain H88) TaxID=544711 RepID=F0U7I4_AJEC8|nr:hypothetical protein HCEG_00123 [Histoplasma capsulatum var. duboisii H88]
MHKAFPSLIWRLADLGLFLFYFPSFIRFGSLQGTVRQVHKKVQEIRYGKSPEDMGGTYIDKPEGSFKRFFELFREELKNQTGRGPPKS